MSDRYKPLFSLKPYSFSVGVPVLIYAGKLLWDNFSSRPVVQLKLQCTSQKVIRSASVEITSRNYSGETVEVDTYTYDQLNIARDQFFGDQEVIPLNDSSITSFSARVIEAVQYDGTVWIPDDEEGYLLTELWPLRKAFGNDAELEKQFQKENGKNHLYAPIVVGDIWRCSCGAINNTSESICHNCRIAANTTLRPDIEGLRRRRDDRLRMEVAEKKRRIKKSKQFGVMIAALLAAIAVIVAVVYFLIIPSVRYKQAAAALAQGDYQAAYANYISNGSFKDSSAKADEVKLAYWKDEYNKILTNGFDIGEDGLSAQDVKDDETVFALAYIDDDDIPELLVSPYGYYCNIFTIPQEYGYLGSPYLANRWLSLNTADSYEIGYYEHYGYVYDRHAGSDYVNELWGPLDESTVPDMPLFSAQTEKYTYFDDYTEYEITWGSDSSDYYSSEDFYNSLGQYVNDETYMHFKLHENTKKNRNKYLANDKTNA